MHPLLKDSSPQIQTQILVYLHIMLQDIILEFQAD